LKELYNVQDDSLLIVEEYLLHIERKNLIQEKLSELEESCRKLLQLCWSGKSMNEVATVFGVTYSHARKKKYGCMSKLVALVRQSSKYNSLK